MTNNTEELLPRNYIRKDKHGNSHREEYIDIKYALISK
jgi:hypothetical protein